MSSAAGKAPASPLLVPTEEEWRAMSTEAREREVLRILDAVDDPQRIMSEGRRHKKAKGQVVDVLGLHYGTVGRVIYLAEELTVMYPGVNAFIPDVLAVLDVPQPDDDPRMAWVVADERRGIDLALEVLHHGNRKKDLVDNVERYAALGIPEYFVYDRLHQQIHGYRLPAVGPGRYQRIVPQFGRYSSTVLGLDLMIQGGKLRFFYGMAELFGSSELIGRLQGMVEDLESRAEQQEQQLDQAKAEVDQAKAEADQAKAEADQAKAGAEVALASLRDGIAALLDARGIPCSEGVRARLASCGDPLVLQRWLLRATSAASAEEIFAAEGGHR
jgi:Uma2 family endonuclease